MRQFLLGVLLFLSARVVQVSAQVVDTTRADSLARDTTDYTGLFLKAQQDARRTIPVPPRIASGALLPPRARQVLDRDSILWHNAETVGDLLTKTPGVYLLRGGWAGRPELPAYQAHGATSVEYLLDGIPYLPLGQDSVMVDPSMLPLSFLDRVEIERLPGLLRVLLYTRRNDRSVPYSRIGIGSGDLQIARYQGQLEKRSARGPGFAAAFDHYSVPVQKGQFGDYSNFQGYLRLEYLRSARFGAEAQLFLSAPDRDSVLSDGSSGAVLSRARRGTRRDLMARVFLAGGGNGLGPRFDVVVSRSAWIDNILKDSTRVITELRDSLGVVTEDTTYSIDKYKRGVSQVAAIASYRLPAASLEASFFWKSAWTPVDLRGRVGLAPVRWFSASLEAASLKHDGSRSSWWLTARAGLILPLGLSAGAVLRRGSLVSRPAILSDSAQQAVDRAVTVAWRASFAEVEASYTSNAGYRPAGYDQYPALPSIAKSGRTDWVSLNARIAPRQWLVFDGWYSTPRGARPEGQPPTHSLINATIQSKFLPTFRSGIFNLKLQVSVENWGTGVLGRDGNGDPVSLLGATMARGFFGLQIGAFTAYYDRHNMMGTRRFYVPGLRIEGYAQTFGVRWEFRN